MKIGNQVRALRKVQGLTLKALAQKSGVALASLSRIENGRMTGTLESHMAICDALGTSLPELYKDLAGAGKAPEVLASSKRTDVFVHDKRSVSEMLISRALDRKMMPIMVRLHRGGATHREENRKGSEKFVYVMRGKVEASVGDKAYALNARDTLYFDSSVSHYFRNAGPAEARLICVVTPPAL